MEGACKAIKEFFDTGKLLGELNATILSLVTKCKTPCKVTDYRPIACCNVVYKGISKIFICMLYFCGPHVKTSRQVTQTSITFKVSQILTDII